jgi:hypothetical protein
MKPGQITNRRIQIEQCSLPNTLAPFRVSIGFERQAFSSNGHETVLLKTLDHLGHCLTRNAMTDLAGTPVPNHGVRRIESMVHDSRLMLTLTTQDNLKDLSPSIPIRRT